MPPVFEVNAYGTIQPDIFTGPIVWLLCRHVFLLHIVTVCNICIVLCSIMGSGSNRADLFCISLKTVEKGDTKLKKVHSFLDESKHQ